MTNERLRIEGLRALPVMAGLCLLIGCGSGPARPVDILPEDMCMHCRMAISEKRCAAEFIDREGVVFKFDDLACMGNYIKERQNKPDIAAYFAEDYGGGGWIKGEDAHYVRSSRISTTMGGGLIAFRDKSAAEAAAARYQGEVVSFVQVLP